MWVVVNLRREILGLFRDAQSIVIDRVRARYVVTASCSRTQGNCVICGTAFEVPPHAAGIKLYCGSRCSMKQRNINRRGVPTTTTGECPTCGKSFEIPPRARGLKVYCGPKGGKKVRNKRRRRALLSKKRVPACGARVSPAIF